jgi:hypothetical protein
MMEDSCRMSGRQKRRRKIRSVKEGGSRRSDVEAEEDEEGCREGSYSSRWLQQQWRRMDDG